VRGLTGAGVARATAGVLAVASLVPLWFGLWAAVISIAAAAQRPDPLIADGDPCCWHPDDWAEVVAGIAFGLATLLVVVTLLYVDLLLARYAVTGLPLGRFQRRRLVAGVTIVAVWAVLVTAL
jgi:hypothetical protein